MQVVLATHRGQETQNSSDRLLLEELAKLGVSAQARPWDDIVIVKPRIGATAHEQLVSLDAPATRLRHGRTPGKERR